MKGSEKMKRSYELRADARKALKGHWFIAFIASLIASMVGGLSSTGGSVSVEFRFGDSQLPPLDQMIGPVDPDVLEQILKMYSFMLSWMTVMAILMSIYSIIYLIIGSAVSVGYSKFNISLIDGNKPRLAQLFECFNKWTTAVASRILTSIFITLWSLLFVIPGIIASFSYAMTPFVLAENPGMTATAAITESKILMQGNKWRLFCLELSFIGWYILGVLTFGIAYIWVIPYHQAAMAAFYRDIKPASVHEPVDSLAY